VGPLSGRRVVTTRDERGRLDSLLAAEGADVIHVPLIAIADAPDDGVSLASSLAELGSFDWLVVTSRHGAQRVGSAAAQLPSVRLAAVGTRTADSLAELAGRRAMIVPGRQTASALIAAMPPPVDGGRRVLIVQADRADDMLATGLAARGFEVTTVVGYSTQLRRPTDRQRRAALAADAVCFASGSAAVSWADAVGTATPQVVVAIGETTRDAAVAAGLDVSHVAEDHSVDGLAAEIASVLGRRP